MSEGESTKARPSGQSLSDPSRIGANEMQEEPAAADKDPVVSNPARVKSGTGGRLDVLDGLRGIAALAVVAYHFFARWAEPHFHPTLYQHGDAIAEWLPLQIAGRFGVYLFFLISGFVIMMTLERATGVLDFTARRAARLWPPMLVCATLSTLIINWSDVAYVYENVARWHVTPVEYVSSIFFIPPDMTADLFGIQQSDTPRWVEGVYWTLWSEVRFYAVIALAFWLSPRHAFLWVWAGLQLASLAVDLTGNALGGLPGVMGPLDIILQPGYLCWFTLGLVAWQWRAHGRHPALIIAGTAAFIALLVGPVIDLSPGGALLAQSAMRTTILYIAVATPFILFLMNSPILKPLTWRPIIAVGLASYPLYLFHERPGMAYLHWLEQAGVHPWAAVFIAIAIAIATALIIHELVENPGKRLIMRIFHPSAKTLQQRFPILQMGRS